MFLFSNIKALEITGISSDCNIVKLFYKKIRIRAGAASLRKRLGRSGERPVSLLRMPWFQPDASGIRTNPTSPARNRAIGPSR